MKPELVKKLKEAGFKFNDYVPVLDTDINGNPIEQEEFVVGRFPTLSELIEACGEHFFELQKSSKLWIATHNPSATAYTGPTSEEAVANLWLALNKK